MAVFDRPQFQSRDALKAALMMKQSLQEFNRQQHPIKVGIGIHTGTGMIGTLGSEERMDSTVIGDVVNTASRLEGLTKIYGCTIIVSQSTLEHLNQTANWGETVSDSLMTQYPLTSDGFYWRWIDCVIPRGKQNAIEIYELLGTLSFPVSTSEILVLSQFDQGIQAWKNQDYEAALGYFQTVLQHNPNDTVTSLYIQRCQEKLGLTVVG